MFYGRIDVGQLKHIISLMGEKGQTVKALFTIANTRTGFDQMPGELQAVAGFCM